ncbi:sensor histidine kinase [Pararhizobium haloflavum]|uniref:sensor histidine kinase n=1 Tax=Pararhizobium haloflavum TaxID=2037914 RepID=UPI000C19EC19|nr:hypothetical protein [Pararhizobium haloflavum]
MTLIQRFSLGLALIALAVVVTTIVAIHAPSLGLSLVPDRGGDRVLVAGAPAGGPAKGSAILSIAPADAPLSAVELGAVDLIDEPDTLGYEAYDAFIARQGELHALLQSNAVEVTYESGGERASTILQTRAYRWVQDLPFAYWYLIACGTVISVIGIWVQSVRPRDTKVRLFAVAGYCVALSGFPAAIYSTRELALEETLFRTLTIVNNIGAIGFGVAMIALFARYPKDLGIQRPVALASIGFACWLAATHLRFFPEVGLGVMSYAGILAAMVAILCLIAAQYVATKRDPAARRALSWLGMSVMVGAGSFVLLVAVPSLIGIDVALPQGYAFGFFVVIYLGVALGLTRFRLFELDRWALSVLSYVLAALVFAAVDFTLVAMLALTPSLSLGITAALVGLVYLPLRNVVVRRREATRDLDPYALFRASTEIALQTSTDMRAQRWRQALEAHFQPLHVDRPEVAPQAGEIEGDGTALILPAYDWSPALRLTHYRGGRALFGPPHLQVVENFAALVMEAEEARRAYDRGVKEERSRIGRDLHDSVGARLISSLRAHDDHDVRQMVRHALGDIREIVGGLSDRRETLANIVAELRAETMERVGGDRVDWPLTECDDSTIVLPYLIFRNFASAHREIVTNAIKHAPGSALRVDTRVRGGVLHHRVSNPLSVHPSTRPGAFSGNGLGNIAERARQCGGRFAHAKSDGFFIVTIELPLEPAEAAA